MKFNPPSYLTGTSRIVYVKDTCYNIIYKIYTIDGPRWGCVEVEEWSPGDNCWVTTNYKSSQLKGCKVLSEDEAFLELL